MDHDRLIRAPAHSVVAIDTTGCGDIFHAGFTYGLVQRWPEDRCLDFGAWAAAQIATRLGGRTGIPAVGDYPQSK
jgi:sugar/nucleoside kinase (ribokinase family)